MKRDIKKAKLSRESIRPMLLSLDDTKLVVGGTEPPVSKGADTGPGRTCQQN